MSDIDLSKYSNEIQKLYCYYCSEGYYYATNKYKYINCLPIELQEDLIKKFPKYIKSIDDQTFNMWQTVLNIDLKYMRHFNKDKCQRYNCCKEIWELYKFLII